MTATCTNPACTEDGIAKTCDVALDPGEVVVCGECQQTCVVAGP